MQKRTIKLLGICTSVFILTACAGKQVAVSESIQQKSVQAAKDSKFTPEQAIKDAEQQLLEAKSARLDFFAPLHLQQAAESIEQAREYLVSPPNDIQNAALMAAIAAQSFISDAYNNKTAVEGHLKESLKHLEILQSLKSPSLLADDYGSVTESLTDLIKDIEQGNTVDAVQGQAGLLEDMSQVEIDTLKKIHLTEAEAYFEKAEDIDADDFAEQSYEKAEKTLEASNNFIEKNFRDRKGVKAAGLEALWATKSAYYVALEAQKLIKMTPEESEKHVLKIMSYLNNVHQKAYKKDIEPQNFYNTTQALVHMVEDLQEKLAQSSIIDKASPVSNPATQNQTPEGTLNKPTESTIQTNAQPTVSKNQVIKDDQPLAELSEPIEQAPPPLKDDEQGFDDIESVKQ